MIQDMIRKMIDYKAALNISAQMNENFGFELIQSNSLEAGMQKLVMYVFHLI